MIWRKYEDIGLHQHQFRPPVNICSVVVVGSHGSQLTFGDALCAIQQTFVTFHSVMLKRSG